jgi:hypothetical protein
MAKRYQIWSLAVISHPWNDSKNLTFNRTRNMLWTSQVLNKVMCPTFVHIKGNIKMFLVRFVTSL